MEKNSTVVMAFGAFDGLHMGHMHYLSESKKLADHLIVSIARDNSYWKFDPRYALPEGERFDLISNLNISTKVILGSKVDALENIKLYNPDVVALTTYQPIDKDLLQNELTKLGLKSKVVQIKPYKPSIYDRIFNKSVKLNKKRILGLPAKSESEKPVYPSTPLPFKPEISRQIIGKSKNQILLLESSSERIAKLNLAVIKILSNDSYLPVVISTSRSYLALSDSFSDVGIDRSKTSIIEFASPTDDRQNLPVESNRVIIKNFSNLSDLIMSIELVLKKQDNFVVIFDSLSMLYSNNSVSDLINFFSHLTNVARNNGKSLFIISSENSLDPQFRSKIVELCDRAVKIGY